jgi:tRNA wybutosine-synthesizing protein 4
MSELDDDLAVQATADDALVSKHSAAALGYFEDNFLRHFVKKPSRRAPLINRGYFARCAAFDHLISTFARENPHGQVVSLGCGYDTSFFRMSAKLPETIKYFEVDFFDVIRRKAFAILKAPDLFELAGFDVEELSSQIKNKTGKIAIRGPRLRLCSADLRDIAGLDEALGLCGLDTNFPMMFFSECVLVYIEPESSAKVIAWAADKCKEQNAGGCFVTYEQIRPDDAFGRVMMENLQRRGCELKGIRVHPDLLSEERRFTGLGWVECTALDMNDIYAKVIPEEQRLAAEKLELFDEFEEWYLILAHYCMAMSVIPAPTFTFKFPIPRKE